jgi:hypothetical protein
MSLCQTGLETLVCLRKWFSTEVPLAIASGDVGLLQMYILPVKAGVLKLGVVTLLMWPYVKKGRQTLDKRKNSNYVIYKVKIKVIERFFTVI